MEGISVRRATLEDKAAVLAINDNVADGRDYLPLVYDRYITSPNAVMRVLLKNDEIIGFGGILIVNDGKTGIGRAARVRPDVEGKGLWGHLKKDLEECIREKGVTESGGTEIQRGRKIRHHANMEMILTKIILQYVVETGKLKKSLQSVSTPELESVTETLLEKLFTSKELRSYLFSNERILVNSIPYKLMCSNIPLILENNDLTEIYSNVVFTIDGCKGLLSVGTVYPVKRPTFAYNIELYGNDNDSLAAHIVYHLKRIIERTYCQVSVHVVIDENISQTEIDKVMLKYGIAKNGITKDRIAKDSNNEATSSEQSVLRRVLYEMKLQVRSRY